MNKRRKTVKSGPKWKELLNLSCSRNVDVVYVLNSSRVAEEKIEMGIGLEFGLALLLNIMVQ